MKFPQHYTLAQIASIISSEAVGDPEFQITGMNEIHVVEHGDIVFVDHPKYYDKALQSDASVVLINKKVDCPTGKALLISEDPFRDFNKLTQFFKAFKKSEVPISPSAEIGKGTDIQPNVFIGNNVKIGENCRIHSNVSIYDDCIIGNNVTLHSGVVLGGDAFYYKKRSEGYNKLVSGGRVVLGDEVDVGANSTIDRGVSGDTFIGKGTKIDNLVQIGHDTQIGKNCLIASQTGISGAVVIEDEVTIWGQVGMASGIIVRKGGVLMAKAGISKSTKENTIYTGNPAREWRTKMKEMALIKRLPELIEKLK